MKMARKKGKKNNHMDTSSNKMRKLLTEWSGDGFEVFKDQNLISI